MSTPLVAELARLSQRRIELATQRAELNAQEVRFLDAALDAGETITSLAELYGFTRQAMGQRYRRLGGARELPAGRPRK